MVGRYWGRVIRFQTLSLALLVACIAVAQDSEDDEADKDEQKMAFIIQEVRSEVKRVAANHLMIKVDAMSAHFKLPESARKRLTLAARGAAKSLVEKQQDDHFKRIIQRQAAILQSHFTINGREVVPPGNKKEEGISVPKVFIGLNEYGAWIQIRTERSGSGTSLSPGLTQLHQEARWTKELARALSAEQLREYQKMEREHLAKACSAMLYGYLHGQLQFTDEQAQKVRGWLDEKFVAKASAVKRRDLSQPTIRPLGQDFSEFEKLLTPVQKERWKDTRFALEQRLPL